jgi:alpha-ketoglutarate-dependent taurine dioxygenase
MLEVRRLGPQIGAEIRGVDVKKLDDAGFATIYRAWLDANVLVVPDQKLEIEDFLRSGRTVR